MVATNRPPKRPTAKKNEIIELPRRKTLKEKKKAILKAIATKDNNVDHLRDIEELSLDENILDDGRTLRWLKKT